MRIAVISTMDGPDWGGSEELWAAMAHEALTAGDDVLVSVNRWTHKPHQISKLEAAGAIVETRSRARQRLRYRSSPPVFLPLSFRSLQRFRPDVVCLSHGATWDVGRDPGLFWSLMRVLGGGRLPYVPVCQYNTDYEPLTDAERRRSREYFGTAEAVAFVADANRVAAERLLAWRMPNAVAVQNPVTVAPTLLPWPADDLTELACVARLAAATKGQDVLLEALAEDQWRSRDWRLSFYGTGPDRDWLGDLGRRYGLSDRIRFCGHIDGVEAVWRRSHLLVLPSRAEGTPLSLLEAMALARPAVVTDVGGNREWVIPDETGFLAPAPTAVSLAKALEEAWMARDRWEAMGTTAHARLVERYDPAPGHTLLRLLQKAVGERPSEVRRS